MSLTDQELLQFAAKACGLEIMGFSTCHTGTMAGRADGGWWDPLEDDGDALRLAVDLSLQVKPCETGVDVCDEGGDELWCEYTEPNACHYQMTRHAIVRAAAEIGQEMGEKH